MSIDPSGGRPLVASLDGMVASAHPLATQAGVGVLHDGGTAFDAVVAVAAALNVVEPFMSGLAGMGFATMWVAAERRVRVLDFVTAVPRSFPADRFNARQQLVRGPLSVGAPGNLAGWCTLSQTYGRLPLDRLLAPAIKLAERGFGIGGYGAEEITRHAPALTRDAVLGGSFGANYPFPAGIELGGLVRQPHLAGTLRQIAAEGPAALYAGSLGQQIIDHLQALGGTLTADDLAAVQPVWRKPVQASYRGLLVHVPPPPCEGFQLLLTLRLLEGFDLARMEVDAADHLDLVTRAIRLAAGVRIANGFPDPATLAELLGDRHVEALRRRLRSGERLHGPTEQWMPEAPPEEDPGHTTSFSIADAEGNLVCVTQSLGSAFGSGVVVPGTGISLNNFLYWADVQSCSPNRTAPGSLLPMCMAPSISTRDGEPELALGTPGSYGILQTQAQAMVQLLDFDRGLQRAVEAPRGRLWDGAAVEFESRIPPAVIAELRRRGHDATSFAAPMTMKVGGMQAIRRDRATGLLTGAADPRRDGYAAGV